MIDLQTLADRVQIEALPGEFTDAIMMHDYDRFASLFAPDGAWRMPHIDQEFVGRRRHPKRAVVHHRARAHAGRQVAAELLPVVITPRS